MSPLFSWYKIATVSILGYVLTIVLSCFELSGFFSLVLFFGFSALQPLGNDLQNIPPSWVSSFNAYLLISSWEVGWVSLPNVISRGDGSGGAGGGSDSGYIPRY